jgi:hypothetical protein
MARSTTISLVAAGLLAASAGGLVADTLVLRDGRRVEGTLIAVRGNTIEFEHQSGRDAARVRQYDRDEVRSIQLDEPSFGNRYQPDTRDRLRGDAGARSGMRERVVSIDARSAWTDVGIDVRAGQEVIFSASGQVRWGPGRRDGAAGERSSPFNRGRPMPDRNAAALIGRVGANGDPFFIGGDTQPIRIRGSGRLFLGINDDYLEDNSGSLRVTVLY